MMRKSFLEAFATVGRLAAEVSETVLHFLITALVLAMGVMVLWWLNTHDVIHEIAALLAGSCPQCAFRDIYTAFGFGVLVILFSTLALMESLTRAIRQGMEEADSDLAELREMIWSVRCEQKRIADYLGDADIEIVDTGVMNYERLQAD